MEPVSTNFGAGKQQARVSNISSSQQEACGRKTKHDYFLRSSFEAEFIEVESRCRIQ
jgi:hypothetical protein